MLRLDRMEISGFKSFSDRTEVRFPTGITAVVGPNGCGKSNIGDAINWALGEQSAKMLRGKHMADVIFNGSKRRKPLGMAEVSLYFSGAEGLKREDHGGIVVTRRLFRSGDSEYLLNGARSRLKDIQEVLNQARVGARTYATIEQGKIDQILNAKPKDRRLLIEDSAGIAIYKHRRRLTELKLEATQANLLRVNDIVLEVERQIRSLKRQAAKARRYRKLRDELRTLERVGFGVRAREMDRELARVQRNESEARDRESGAAARLSRLEVEVLERRGELEGAGENLTEAAERFHELELEIDRDESQIRRCSEKIAESSQAAERQSGDVTSLAQRRVGTLEQSREKDQAVAQVRGDIERHESRLAALQASLDAANAQQTALREQIEALRRQQFDSMNRAAELRNRLRSTEEGCQRNRFQQARLEAERSEATDERSRLENETRELAEVAETQRRRVDESSAELVRCEVQLRDARLQQSAEVEAMAQAREREKSAAARLHTLEDVATRFAGVSDGVRALLTSGPAAGVQPLGVVADFVQAGRDVESAAEGYLQSFLPTVIVADDDEVCRAAELLQSEGAGRTTLISRSQPAGGCAVGTSRNGKGELPPELLNDPRVRGKLRDRLTLITSANGVVQDRIGDALLVDSLQAALELHRRHPAVDYLTPDGDVVYASGVVSARGRERGDQGLLAHTRRMQEARADAAAAVEVTAGLQLKVKKGSDDVTALESRLAACRQSADEASKRKLELDVAVQRSTEDRERTGRRSQVLTDELAGLKDEAERLEGESRTLAEQVGEAERSHRELELALERRVAELRERESLVARLAEEVADLRADLAARRQRQESVEQEARRLAEELAELDSRIRLLEAEAEQSRQREQAARDLLARTENEMTRRLAEREKLATRKAELERQISERRQTLSAGEDQLRVLRGELEREREQSRESELERTRCASARDHLDDLCRQELGITAAEAAGSIEDDGTDVDLEALEAQVVEAKQQIEKIGPVNLTAIEEFTELEERHLFLTSQRKDLEESMASLKETIRRLNRSSRERFTEAFEAIRTSYQEIFKLLFRGGRADLRLEEGEDVLEAGVEIMAQPPGKRLGNVQLLSGGEKALSAIALLFAVFRYQPSPFCLLDEVDAALDDANVGRFTHMLQEYARHTQFIVVTHNKLSMEVANLMYGVTMEEPGVSKLVSLELQ